MIVNWKIEAAAPIQSKPQREASRERYDLPAQSPNASMEQLNQAVEEEREDDRKSNTVSKRPAGLFWQQPVNDVESVPRAGVNTKRSLGEQSDQKGNSSHEVTVAQRIAS